MKDTALWVMPAMLISLTAVLGPMVPAAQAALAVSQGSASISAGGNHTCTIESGKAYCWGDNNYGELGDGSTSADSSVPVPVDTSGALTDKTLAQITAGGQDTCVLDRAGAAYCWGENTHGQLGDGSTTDSTVPVAVSTTGGLFGKTLTQITTDGDQTCALDRAGKAYCWGENGGGFGQGGVAAYYSVPVPVDTSGVLAGKTLTQITADGDHTCALDSAGAAYCWGSNGYGGLGDGSTFLAYGPVAVDTNGVLAGKTLTQIAGGDGETCALDASGAAYCWGLNTQGQLGDGCCGDAYAPVAVDANGVLAGKTLTQIAGGGETCALDASGAAYCWGNNYSGELGDGNTTGSGVPVAVDTRGVLADKTLTQITVGAAQACALDSAGAAYCWGLDSAGQLGDDSTTTSTVPVLAGPQAPADVMAVPGDTKAKVSWTAPVGLDGSTLKGYTATASPNGKSCSSTGATSCTITGLANGTSYSIIVIAHTTAGDSGASAVVGITTGSGLAFTSDSADMVTFGLPFSITVTATGSPAPTISKNGPLPPGVSLKDHTGGAATISGTPANSASGMYPVTLTAKNKNGTATQAFTLTVTRTPGIKKIPAITAKPYVALSLAITATGYPAPALTESGSLPGWLTFTGSQSGTATITGSPPPYGSGGSFPITVTATNSFGTASRTFTVKVNGAPAISSADTAEAFAGSPFSFQVTATGFPGPKITAAGHLPEGVTFTSATAAFSGTPKAGSSGIYPITITAKNTSGTVTQIFILVVS